MLEKQERTIIKLVILTSVIILVVVVILAMVERPSDKQIYGEHHNHEYPLFEPLSESSGWSAKTDTELSASGKVSLNDVIKAARTWQPAYTWWFGKPASDFTLTDITGKKHKLSDYRGKNVMIVFWATWCRPCLIEVPHLIELRKRVSADELAILAISNEKPALVKKFVAWREINYTVLSDLGTMPSPFNSIRSIPCSFFISPDGKIKLATEGLISLGEIRAILQAE